MDVWGPFIWNVGLWCREWIPVLAPTGVVFAALVAYKAYRQRLVADKRDQWWTRAQWAIDSALDSRVDVKLTGLKVLTSLKAGSLATPEDVALFNSIARGIQNDIEMGAVAVSEPASPDRRTMSNDKPSSGRDTERAAAAGTFTVRLSALGERTVTVKTLGEKRLLEEAEKLLQTEPAKSAKSAGK